MTTGKSEAERAISEVNEAVTGENTSLGVNPELAKSDEAPLDDRTAHTRVSADAVGEFARPDPDAETDIGASDDTYRRTRGIPAR
ncbi:MAG: hypothetical protein ACR2JY_24170 [Chloroflexota bacterium]